MPAGAELILRLDVRENRARMRGQARVQLVIATFLIAAGCSEASPGRRAILRGSSSLVPLMERAAADLDVPAEILAAAAWSETSLSDHSKFWGAFEDARDEGHAPRSAGVMGLPERGTIRSVARAAELTGVDPHAIVFDDEANIRGAAAILRAIADEMFGSGVLPGGGDRDLWLLVVERYMDAGAAGARLALEVRRTIARGLETVDDAGRTFEILPHRALRAPDRGPSFGARGFALSGEYPGSTWVGASTSNYTSSNRTADDIDVIVIHTVQGSYAGAISWFQNPSAGVSAHYVVRRSDGAITQMVRHADVAWHAGNWSYNLRSIGIEHEGFVSDPSNYTDAMYAASADLVRWLSDDLGIPKDRSHIIGHIEVPSATHTDPGPYWDWDYFMSLVNGSGATPSQGMGVLKGVVYVGTDTQDRIAGAEVTASPGGASVFADASGYFEMPLSPGPYTITAAAPGFVAGSVTRSVVEGAETWGSISLARVSGESGVYRGVVYDARSGDASRRLGSATVTLSNGQVAVTSTDGAFQFVVSPGFYTATAELEGWESNTTRRTVIAGGTSWGSIGLVPAGWAGNRPPKVPALASPLQGVTVVGARPIFTVDGLEDPEGDPLVLDVEIYGAEPLSMRVSTIVVEVPLGSSLVSWRHPGNDLPRAARLLWRARANDGGASSPWTAPQGFVTDEDGLLPEPSGATWVAEPLAGVGSNQPPGAPDIRDPAADTIVGTTRPRIAIGAARDAEGDELEYQVQVSIDDLFAAIESESARFPAQGTLSTWVVGRSLAPGGRYYVRARAADGRVFGSWSETIAFSVAQDAARNDENRPDVGRDQGDAPEIRATLADEGGCSSIGATSGGFPMLLSWVWWLVIRRRKARRAFSRALRASPRGDRAFRRGRRALWPGS